MKYDRKLYICNDEGEKFFGLGPVMLLERVREYGSLNKAAGDLGMSYHKALKIVSTAESEFGCCLINKKIGGEKGGGSALTTEAIKIIEKYRRFEKEADERIAQVFSDIFKSEG